MQYRDFKSRYWLYLYSIGNFLIILAFGTHAVFSRYYIKTIYGYLPLLRTYLMIEYILGFIILIPPSIDDYKDYLVDDRSWLLSPLLLVYLLI